MCLSGRCSSCQHEDKTNCLTVFAKPLFKVGDRIRLKDKYGPRPAGAEFEVTKSWTEVGSSVLEAKSLDVGIAPIHGALFWRFELVEPKEPDFKALAEEFRQIAARRIKIVKTFHDSGFTVASRVGSTGTWCPLNPVKAEYRFYKNVTTTEEY